MKKFLLFKTYHVHLGTLKKKVDHHALEDSFSSGLVCTRTHLLTFVWNSFKENTKGLNLFNLFKENGFFRICYELQRNCCLTTF